MEIRERNPDVTPTQALLAGDAQFGISDTSLVLTRMRGEPVTVLAAIFQHSPLAIISLKKDGFIGPLDLKNKRVMYQRNIDGATLTAMFAEFAIKPEDIKHVPHTFKDDALLTGEVDAMSAYLSNQPFFYKQRNIDINIMSPASYGIDFYGDMLFVTEDYLKKNPETVEAFKRASLKGWDYALSHPEQVIDWIQKEYKSLKSREHLLFEAGVTRRMIQPDLIELGHVNINRFQKIAEVYQQLGMVPSETLLSGIYYREHLNTGPASEKWRVISLIIALTSALVLALFWGINHRLKKLVSIRTQELEESKQALEKLSLTDALTGIGNRRHLDNFLALEISKAKRSDAPLSLIMFDVDFFKQINDELGHSTGDSILRDLTQLIINKIKRADLLGRWGGEEFMLLCPDTDANGAEQLAEILRAAIENHDFGISKQVHCSFGVTALEDKEESPESLFARADQALYKAKECGRNRVIVYRKTVHREHQSLSHG